MVALLDGSFVGSDSLLEATESCGEHEQGALGGVEACEHGIGYIEVVRRVDEFICPAVEGSDVVEGVAAAFDSSLYCGAYGKNLMACVLSLIDYLAAFGSDVHFL